MMRRHQRLPVLAATRAVTSYEFGHLPLDADMLPESHIAERKLATVGPVRVSKLNNGARIVTQNLDGPHIAIGAYVEAGAKFDPAPAPGLSYVLRWGLSSSNMDNSLYQQDRNMRAFGAAREHCDVRKRFIGLKAECPAGEHWERLAQDVLTSLSAPRLPEYDVERFRDTMDNLLQEMRWNAPREYAIDQLETAAFYREALGNPRMVAPELNASSSHGAMLAQWAQLCRPERVVIAGVNVDHDTLVAAYENAPFPHSANAPHHARSTPKLPALAERQQYTPGGERIEIEDRSKATGTKPDMDEEGIIAIGLPTHGADANQKGYASALVAREIAAMSFGESLAVNQDAPHHGVESFYRPYSEAGLLGATIRSAPADLEPQLRESVKVLRSLDTSADVIARAKSRAVSRFASDNLESARDYVDFLGTNLVSNSMHRVTPDQVFENIGGVDAAAVRAIVDDFKATRPAMFATGEVAHVPSLRQMNL